MSKSISIFLILLVTIQIGCDNESQKRKIKLSHDNNSNTSVNQLSTTIRFKERERLSIAVMFFQNHTGDQNMQWLQKGLTEMLIRALSQSNRLSVLSIDRLYEVIERLGAEKSPENINLDMTAIVGKEANVEGILVGNITKIKNNLQINVKLQDPNQGIILKEESVEGSGLENILAMVDDLSEKIRADLQITLDKAEQKRGIADLSTNSVEAWQSFTTGTDLVQKVLNNEAIPYFEKAIQLDSSFVSAHLQLCTRYFSTGEFEKAYQILQKLQALKSNASDQDRYQIELLEANVNNDITRLINTIQNWVRKYPNDRDAYYTLANYYRNWQNHPNAIENLEQVIRIDPNYKLAYNQIAYSYADMGDVEKALPYVDKYIELSPNEANPYDSKGEIYYQVGDFKSAEKYFKKALKKNDNFLHSIQMLGNVYLFSGRCNRALKYFNQYLERTSDRMQRANAYAMLGRTYLKMGERDKVIEYYQKSLQENIFNFNPIEMIHKQYMDNGNTAKAKAEMKNIYANAREMLKIKGQETQVAGFLAWFSINWDVNVDESIQILSDLLPQVKNTTSDEVNTINLKFLLTLLHQKKNQFEKMDQLWADQEILPTSFWKILEKLHNFSFSENWRAFGSLNKTFYHNLEYGEEFYKPLIATSEENNVQAMEMMFRLLLSDLYLKKELTEPFFNQLKIVGTPPEKTWMIIGPFANKNGFHTKLPPERKIQLDKVYKGKSDKITWQSAVDGLNDGFVELSQIYAQYNWSVAYGLIYIKSSRGKMVQFRFGTDDENKIWLNDCEVWRFHQGGPAVFDSYKVNVTLKKGLNKVLVKICNSVSDWGFFFRVTDDSGQAVEGIEFVSADSILQ